MRSHGKVVDFITYTFDDGTLYFTVRFSDQTSICVRYACDMFAVGAELSDWQSGDFHIIREYMKPIPRMVQRRGARQAFTHSGI